MAERPSMPTFVPRTVASSARTALTAAPEVAGRSTQPAASDAGEAARTIEATTAAVEQATTATADMRVAEALGLRPTIAPTAAATVAAARTAPAARATTPLGRALAHAAWVDAQLRTVAAAPVEPVARTTGGYV